MSLEWEPVSGQRGSCRVHGRGRAKAAGSRHRCDRRLASRRARHGRACGFSAGSARCARNVAFKAADGTTRAWATVPTRATERAESPAVIFVHGGPPRQMLLGWHYMGYYSNAYAVNQYLAAHGFVVLSVNYRLGIGYGRAFPSARSRRPRRGKRISGRGGGRAFSATRRRSRCEAHRHLGRLLWRLSDGARAGAQFRHLQGRSRPARRARLVGPSRHAIRRNTRERYESRRLEAAKKVAFLSSPDASIATWKSPVLLIQGDDDRNVPFHQTVDLARRLDAPSRSLRRARAPQRDPWFPAPQLLAARRRSNRGVSRAQA